MPCLFALDQNFPQPIVEVLSEFMAEAELVAVADIDDRLTNIDDWELLLALHHHAREWDGLITTDSGMLSMPRELSVLMQTHLTLVVADANLYGIDLATGEQRWTLPGVTAPFAVGALALRYGIGPAFFLQAGAFLMAALLALALPETRGQTLD